MPFDFFAVFFSRIHYHIPVLHESFAPLLIEMHFLVLCLAFRLLVVYLRVMLANVAREFGLC